MSVSRTYTTSVQSSLGVNLALRRSAGHEADSMTVDEFAMEGLSCTASRPKHVDAVITILGSANADLPVQLNSSSPVLR